MFNSQDFEDVASRNLAERPYTDLKETLDTSFNAMEQERSISVREALRDQYSQYRQHILEKSGVDLPDPLTPATEREMRRHRLDESIGLLGKGGLTDDDNIREYKIRKFHDQVNHLRKSYPDIDLKTSEDIAEAIKAERQKVREARENAAKGEFGIKSGVTAFVGGMGAAMTDPVNLLTLPFGAAWSTGVLRTAIAEAAIGGVSETAIQTVYQMAREDIGEKANWNEALANIGLVTVGAGVLGAGIKGGAGAIRAVRRKILREAENLPVKDPDVEAAIAIERRALDVEEKNPYSETPHGEALHSSKMVGATEALTEGRVFHDEVEPATMSAIVDEVAQLTEGQKNALRTAAAQAYDAYSFRDFVSEVTRPVEPTTDRLMTFLAKKGGIQEQSGELATIGITPRNRPGFIRKAGMTLDQAGEALTEAGYFSTRPTVREVLDAIEQDFKGQPLFASADDIAIREQARVMGDIDDTLAGMGVNLREMTPEEARQVVNTLAKGLDEYENRARTDPPPENATGASAIEAERLNDDLAEESIQDSIRLADEDIERIRSMYEGKEDTVIEVLDEETGLPIRMTVKEMLDEFDQEQSAVELLKGCGL